MTIGEQIRALRKKENLTQEQFAEKVGLSTNNRGRVVGLIETGRAHISITTLKRICEVFNKSLKISIVDKK